MIDLADATFPSVLLTAETIPRVSEELLPFLDPVEPQFWANLLTGLTLDLESFHALLALPGTISTLRAVFEPILTI